jgi:alpha-tubulin suppressor-like RCC1 family protein
MRFLSRCSRSSAPLVAAVPLFIAACGDGPAEPAPSVEQAVTAQTAAPPALVQVSAGAAHTCGITAAGQAWCWGHGTNGQLGNGERVDRLVPTPVSGSLVFRQISASWFHTCGVTTDNRIWCWGANFAGELGDGTLERRTSPVRVSSTLRFQTVSAGSGQHTCALTTDRVAYCWGLNGDGELGDGTLTSRTLPVPVRGGRTWREISAGYTHTCGVTPERVALCWGSDEHGELGDDTERHRRRAPRLVPGGLAFDRISAGMRHSCGVTTDARAFCWGVGTEGQIGDGRLVDRYVPRAVAGSLSFGRVSAGGTNHSCGETLSDKIYCWGSNDGGQLGDGTRELRTRPKAVASSLVFTQMSAGNGHTCAVTSRAVAYCWGDNQVGQLGDGSSGDSRAFPGPLAGGS